MALLQSTLTSHYLLSLTRNDETCFHASSSLAAPLHSSFPKEKPRNVIASWVRINQFELTKPRNARFMPSLRKVTRSRLNASSKVSEECGSGDGKKEKGGKTSGKQIEDDVQLMDEEERREWRRKIREVIDKSPDVEEETDPIEKRKKMQKLLEQYPLIVEEEDPDWPEDADGWGFNLGQFFNNITIKNVRKDDDENYDSDKEIVWQDDNYIRPIKDITSKEWEETVFKDISPLVVFVHNRYKRPKENEKVREALEEVAHIFWNCGLPSPRCVAVDAVVELDLVSVLKVPVFPEVIFTKAGKILYRDKAVRTADELSKIMAFFYFGAAKPPCLDKCGDSQELIPSVPNNS